MPVETAESTATGNAAVAVATQPSPGFAAEMLDALASVGVRACGMTYIDLAGGLVHFDAGLTLGQLRDERPRILSFAADHRHNIIIRPATSAQNGADPTG